MSSHQRRKIPSHTHSTEDVLNVKTVAPQRPTAKNVHATDVITGDAQWLDNLMSGVGTGAPKLDFDGLDEVPLKLDNAAFNHILNPSFEYGTWGGDETQSSNQAKYGLYSARLENIGSGATLSGFSNYIDLRGLEKFSISVWLYISSMAAGGQLNVWVYYYDLNKNYLAGDYIGGIGTLTGVWEQASFTKTSIPSNYAFARVFAKTEFANITGYVDGWSFNIGDQVPTFKDNTVYSLNWMPEKLDTTASSTIAWSSVDWTDILTLAFECESTMLLLIVANCDMDVATSTTFAEAYFRLELDGVELTITTNQLGHDEASTFYGVYSMHAVEIVAKGSHTLKMRMKAVSADNTVHAYSRRLTILKGFYQGGTT